MSPIELILSRLPDPKPSGQNRWRCACPVCGNRNRSTLSIGVRDDGAVLLKCFKSYCDVEAICGALGITVTDLFPPRESYGKPLAKRNLISHRQAFELVDDEVQLIAICGANVGHGVVLTDADLKRCLQAAARISYLRGEVMS